MILIVLVPLPQGSFAGGLRLTLRPLLCLCCSFCLFVLSVVVVVVVTVPEGVRFAAKAEEAFNLALDYFRSADDVYHQVGMLMPTTCFVSFRAFAEREGRTR